MFLMYLCLKNKSQARSYVTYVLLSNLKNTRRAYVSYVLMSNFKNTRRGLMYLMYLCL